MYKELGKFGNINFRSIRYMEDRMMEDKYGYRLGFDIILLPSLIISNNFSRVLIGLKWLSWEFLWWKYKKIERYVDIQGVTHIYYHGVRYFLSLKWLFRHKIY